MSDVDALVRGAAIGIMLLTAAEFFRAWRKTNLSWVAALYTAGCIGYVLWGHPAVSSWPPLARLLVGVLALSTPFFFWAFARLTFDDGFSLRPAHWALLGAIVVAGVAQAVIPGDHAPWLRRSLRVGFRAMSLALIFHVLWLVWRDRAVDLVEKRARFRVVFLIVTGTVAALVVFVALFYAPSPERPMPARLSEAFGFLALSLGIGIGIMLLRPDSDLLAPGSVPLPPSQFTAEPAATTQPESDPDSELLARLDTQMREREAWRETGLTIGGLAARAAIPEYRLRRLINQRLGFRNFTAFLNKYRLAAAAARLADPKEVRLPVLTIALELGWGSIGPFNRAFRAQFGVTPTDYRRARTASSGPSG